jgi:hypothetical protein
MTNTGGVSIHKADTVKTDQRNVSERSVLESHANATKTAPLIVEAESAYRDLDATSANGIEYVRDCLCFPMAAGSFEDGMGA